ncbi:hypothetical protein NHQ30_000319 [Ciborinia camelliae]|nr:hypothetical protein NHQ30_000319 [Ciborinia camelliae]
MKSGYRNPLELSPEWREQPISRMVDHRAEVTPHLLYAEYPISPVSYDAGFRGFTYANLANAINGIAWWLRETLGTPKSLETLAYIGPNDIRIPALILGASKAGYAIFLTSPRNSVSSQLQLLQRTDCSTILFSSPQSPAVTALLATPNHGLRSLEIPSIDELVDKPYSRFPYEKILDEIRTEPLCKVHTSGSTGVPKTLTITHAGAKGTIDMMGMSPPEGWINQCQLWQGRKVFAVFPPFHAMYLGAFLFIAVPYGSVMIAPLAAAIPTADGMVKAHKKSPFGCGFILPSMVRELSDSPDLLDYCSENLDILFFAGGDLPQEVGDVVASRIPLYNHYGSTESGLLTLLLPIDITKRDRKDWKYLQFAENLGVEFQQFNDNEYELVIRRSPEIEKYQPAFEMFPDSQEYRMRDLFLRHPTNENLWKWCARADDIIVFLTGEKTNPISMEQHVVSQNPEIIGLLVAGSQRFQASLLIHSSRELVTPKERAAFIEEIWPSIEEANQNCPAHARVAKSHILFTVPSKPMLFSGKGTIQRASTLKLYDAELNRLYEDADKMSANERTKQPVVALNFGNLQNVEKHVKEIFSLVTNWKHIGNEDDFFVLGMDSLQTLVIVRRLREDFALPSISPSTVYTNPSISTLSGALIKLHEVRTSSQKLDEENKQQARKVIFEKYRAMIDRISSSAKGIRDSKEKYVLLTGSTGALGSYILHSLLRDPHIKHIYCLNRGPDGRSRQTQRNQSLGLSDDSAFDASQVTFLKINPSKPELGLGHSSYIELQTNVTHIIHNAWPVNFNMSLSSFTPNLTGLVSLLRFQLTADQSPALLFISSVSANLKDETPTGYAQSKRIAEELLQYASAKFSHVFEPSKVPISVARVGQIAGARDFPGLWNRAEWFPSLIISSVYLGAIPDSIGTLLGNINWVPIDVLAEVLVELFFNHASVLAAGEDRMELTIFHPLNPQTIQYEALLPNIISAVQEITHGSLLLEPISPEDWIERVKLDISALAGTEGNLDVGLSRNPAAKLVDFYANGFAIRGQDDMEILDTGIKLTSGLSERLGTLGAVRDEWVRKWLQEWISSDVTYSNPNN